MGDPDPSPGLGPRLTASLHVIMALLLQAARADFTAASRVNESCSRSLLLPSSSPPLPLSPNLLHNPSFSRVNMTFVLKACGQVSLTFVIADVTGVKLRVKVLEVIINITSDVIAAYIRDCEQGLCLLSNVSTIRVPDSCRAFHELVIDWAGGVRVEADVNGTRQTVTTSSGSEQLSNTSSLQNIFLAYSTPIGLNDNSTAMSEWIINGVMCELTVKGSGSDDGVAVSLGHHVGGVIAALLCGIVLGYCYVRHHSKELMCAWKRDSSQQKPAPSGSVSLAEEMSALVTSPSDSAGCEAEPLAPVTQAPPRTYLEADSPSTRRPSNTYTPYLQMTGSVVKTPASSDVKVDTADVKLKADVDETRATAGQSSWLYRAKKSDDVKVNTADVKLQADVDETHAAAGQSSWLYPAKMSDDVKFDTADVKLKADDDVSPAAATQSWQHSGRQSEGPGTRGRVSAPLPSLPGHYKRGATASLPVDVSHYVTPDNADSDAASDEYSYINGETHVYEGVRPGAPVYENRDVGYYDSLDQQQSQRDKTQTQ